MTVEPIEQPDVELVEVPSDTPTEAVAGEPPQPRSGVVPAFVFSVLVLGLGAVGLVHLLGGAGMAVVGAVGAGLGALMVGAGKYKRGGNKRAAARTRGGDSRRSTGLRMPGLPKLGPSARAGRTGSRASGGKRAGLGLPKIPTPRMSGSKGKRPAASGGTSGARKSSGAAARGTSRNPLRRAGGVLTSSAGRVGKLGSKLATGRGRAPRAGTTGAGSSKPKRRSGSLRKAASGALGLAALPFAAAAARRASRKSTTSGSPAPTRRTRGILARVSRAPKLAGRVAHRMRRRGGIGKAAFGIGLLGFTGARAAGRRTRKGWRRFVGRTSKACTYCGAGRAAHRGLCTSCLKASAKEYLVDALDRPSRYAWGGTVVHPSATAPDAGAPESKDPALRLLEQLRAIPDDQRIPQYLDDQTNACGFCAGRRATRAAVNTATGERTPCCDVCATKVSEMFPPTQDTNQTINGKEPTVDDGMNEPDGMLDYQRNLQAEADYAADHAARARQFTDMAESELPLNAPSREAREAIADAWQMLADMTSEAAATFAQDHEDDLERLENPRTGEEQWDVSRNDG